MVAKFARCFLLMSWVSHSGGLGVMGWNRHVLASPNHLHYITNVPITNR